MRLNSLNIQFVPVLAMVAIFVSGSVIAEEFPVKVTLSETITHDDNVFRSAAQAVADTIVSSSIRVTFDKEFSRQRLQALLSYSDNRFQRLDILNNGSSSYLLGWQGTFPGRCTADASWTRSENLVNFADVRANSIKDVVTSEALRFRFGYSPHPDVPVYVQRTHSTTRNSAGTLAFNDLDVDSTEVGVQYNSPLGNQAVLFFRRTDGHYPNLPGVVGADYQQDDIQAAVVWKPGIKSALNLQYGQTRREQTNQPTGGFSGNTGRLNFEWAPTTVTSFNANVAREVTSITSFTQQNFGRANFAVVQSYGLGARWTPTAKLSADARVSHQSRDIGGVPADKATTTGLGLRYVPTRSVQISLQLTHEERRSENPRFSLPYKANVGSLSASFSF